MWINFLTHAEEKFNITVYGSYYLHFFTPATTPLEIYFIAYPCYIIW